MGAGEGGLCCEAAGRAVAEGAPSAGAFSNESHFESEVPLTPETRSAKSSGLVACRSASS